MSQDDPESDLNPQAEHMASEAMVRTLSAQAEAIWPQEAPLFDRYGLGPEPRILDAGCGTGEITARLAARYPAAELLGVDILDGPLAVARQRHGHFGERVRFEKRSIFGLDLPDAHFDLTVCRHVVQSVPRVDRVLAELRRVTRPQGWLHLVAEDYGMLHFQVGGAPHLDPEEFFPAAPIQFGAVTGTDLRIGRNIFGVLGSLGFSRIMIDYVVVDTLRVPRATFAEILVSWRDGYADTMAVHTRFSRERAVAYFDEMIATIRDPARYAVWLVPVVAAQVP